jgi:hypothetical protein
VITKLIIGPAREPGEYASPLAEHPYELHKWVALMDGLREPHTICTYSPTVIHQVWALLREFEDPFTHVTLRGVRDVPLLDVKTPEWLAHFAIEDLYIHGEFDAVLKGA